MLNDIKRILITEEQLKAKVEELAAKINEDYKEKDPLFIVILKGSFVFAADLFKYIKLKSAMTAIGIVTGTLLREMQSPNHQPKML